MFHVVRAASSTFKSDPELLKGASATAAVHRPRTRRRVGATGAPSDDRAGRVRDPQGNLWWVMERREEVDIDDLNRRWTEPKYVEMIERFADSDPFPRA